MAFGVDANILIYAANTAAPESVACRRLLDEWRGGADPWFLDWGVIYEFLRVVTHPRVLRDPISPEEAWGFVDALLASPSLHLLLPTDRHAAILAQTLSEVPDLHGNDVFDLRTAVLLREHGVSTIVTHDRDFRRFPFLEVVDPLA